MHRDTASKNRYRLAEAMQFGRVCCTVATAKLRRYTSSKTAQFGSGPAQLVIILRIVVHALDMVQDIMLVAQNGFNLC